MEKLEELWVYLPAELKLELGFYAARNKMYLTDVVLPLIANHIGRSDLVPVKRMLYNPVTAAGESAPGRRYTRKGKPRNPGGGMERLRLSMPSELRLEFKAYAARNKLSLTEIVLRLIANHIGRPDLAPVKGKLPSPEGEEATHAEEE